MVKLFAFTTLLILAYLAGRGLAHLIVETIVRTNFSLYWGHGLRLRGF